VTYSPIIPGKPGAGAVDVFDTNGNLLNTLIPIQPNGILNVPWGMTPTIGILDEGGVHELPEVVDPADVGHP
jgi:hypothetical protein